MFINFDELYGIALLYKTTKLWEIVWYKQLFAVKLSDGNIGYINIEDDEGGQELNLYIGEKGLYSFYNMVKLYDGEGRTAQLQEYANSIECLSCEFVNRDDLTPEEVKQVNGYARRYKIKLAKNYGYPRFVAFVEEHNGWYLSTKKQKQYLYEALIAAIELYKILVGNNLELEDIGFREKNGIIKTIPMVELRKGKYVWSVLPIPRQKDREYPFAKVKSDIGIAKLKKFPKMGRWECELIYYPCALQQDENAPVYPSVIMAVEERTGYQLTIKAIEEYNKKSLEEKINRLIDSFLEQEICPEEIKVRNQRTYALLKDFCEKLNIKIKKDSKCFALDKAEEEFYQYMDKSQEEQMEEALEWIEKLSDEKILSLPEAVGIELKEWLYQDILPEEFAKRIKKIYKIPEDIEKN